MFDNLGFFGRFTSGIFGFSRSERDGEFFVGERVSIWRFGVTVIMMLMISLFGKRDNIYLRLTVGRRKSVQVCTLYLHPSPSESYPVQPQDPPKSFQNYPQSLDQPKASLLQTPSIPHPPLLLVLQTLLIQASLLLHPPQTRPTCISRHQL